MNRDHASDITHLVVVPDDPGPVVPLAQIDRPRAEVDQVLDEMFGDVDDEGPGIADAVLLTGGLAAVVAAQVAALPAAVLVGGIAGVGLGSVLPIRSGLRRWGSKRREKRIEALIGRGHLLDTRHAAVRDLVQAHLQTMCAVAGLSPAHQVRVRNVAHSLLTEVATLLDGNQLSNDAELAYVSPRLEALRLMLRAVEQFRDNPHLEARRSHVAARQTVESLANASALHEARELTDDLATEPGV